MLQAAAEVLIGVRQQLYDTLKELTQEQWFAQPEGFANNIAWNVGHLIVAQQGLVYRRLGVPGYITPEMAAMYRPGTSPADWTTTPDTDELLRLFIELPQKMAEDIAAGKFDHITPPSQTGGLPPAKSVAHALIFNQFHEGMHAGNIGDLLAFV